MTAQDIGVGGGSPLGPFSLTVRKQLDPNTDVGGQVITVPAGARIAVNGAMKTPSLRNVALTGPYMHNGGMKNLTEVVQFYARGGNFHDQNIDDLDPDITVLPELNGNPENVAAMVAFLNALTDPRVLHEMAPFDHPELLVPHGHTGFKRGVAKDILERLPETGELGRAALPTFEEILTIKRLRN